MINSKRVLAVVTARGGSKGLPRKNILPLGGKPLIAWTLEAARDALYVDRTVVSTDDDEIAAVAAALGAEIIRRPSDLAVDAAPVEPAVLHALDSVGGQFDYVVLLQPTSPFREGADIDGCVEACVRADAPACIAMSEPPKSPFWMFRLEADKRLESLFPGKMAWRRQDLPPVYSVNGVVYVARVDWLRRTRRFLAEGAIGWVMPRERTFDIDSAFDMEMAEAYLVARAARKAH